MTDAGTGVIPGAAKGPRMTRSGEPYLADVTLGTSVNGRIPNSG